MEREKVGGRRGGGGGGRRHVTEPLLNNGSGYVFKLQNPVGNLNPWPQ